MTDFSTLEKSIIKKYGDGIIVPADSIVDFPKQVVSVGPMLDYGLSGGIPEGSWVILSGLKKCGKTTTALQIAANYQKHGRKVFYTDAEGRFKLINLYGVNGFDGSKVRLIHSTPDRQLSGEDFLLINAQLMRAKENMGSLFILDSTSTLCPADVLASGEVRGNRRSTTPKLLSDFCKQMAGVVPVMNHTVIIIQHLINNTSGYGPPLLEDGGTAIGYQGDVHLRCTNKPTDWMDGETKIGQIVTWDVVTSALGPPMGKVESWLRYGYGIDDVTEMVQLCSDLQIVERKASWYSFEYNGETIKQQGKEKFTDYLRENEDVYTELKKRFHEMLA